VATGNGGELLFMGRHVGLECSRRLLREGLAGRAAGFAVTSGGLRVAGFSESLLGEPRVRAAGFVTGFSESLLGEPRVRATGFVTDFSESLLGEPRVCAAGFLERTCPQRERLGGLSSEDADFSILRWVGTGCT